MKSENNKAKKTSGFPGSFSRSIYGTGLIIILSTIVISTLYYLDKEKFITSFLPQSSNQPEGCEEIANPASVYCQEKEGESENRALEGGTKSFCVFEDGSECEEWQFLRAECKKGEKICKDFCGDGTCQEIVCLAIGCPCAETKTNCPVDCK